MNDNPIGWLEVTDVCNLGCKGCYRQKLEGHKNLEQIKDEIRFLKKWRNCDNISIAGGEPALHPDIVSIVNFIRENRMKPFLLSNGMALSKNLLTELKKAGLTGLGLHVDSFQNRPGWEGKNEVELCSLRKQYADMVHSMGGLSCSFNITVYRENFNQIPDLITWALQNAKTVNGFTFITYRAAILGQGREYVVNGRKVNLDERALGYAIDKERSDDIRIKTGDVYNLIKKHFPEYTPSAYLGGSKQHDSFKWLAGYLFCSGERPIGSLGRKSMELAQAGHHLLFGRYFLYLKNKSIGKSILAMSLIDPEVRKILVRFLASPLSLFKPLRGIGIGIVQAPDALPNGEVDMCDSCPDMTVYDGKLVHSCRMDEYRKFGALLTPVTEEER